MHLLFLLLSIGCSFLSVSGILVYLHVANRMRFTYRLYYTINLLVCGFLLRAHQKFSKENASWETEIPKLLLAATCKAANQGVLFVFLDTDWLYHQKRREMRKTVQVSSCGSAKTVSIVCINAS